MNGVNSTNKQYDFGLLKWRWQFSTCTRITSLFKGNYKIFFLTAPNTILIPLIAVRNLRPTKVLVDKEGHIHLILPLSPSAPISFEQYAQYLPPEILEGRIDIGKESDWWSFGVLMYLTLAGKVSITLFGNPNLQILFLRLYTLLRS